MSLFLTFPTFTIFPMITPCVRQTPPHCKQVLANVRGISAISSILTWLWCYHAGYHGWRTWVKDREWGGEGKERGSTKGRREGGGGKDTALRVPVAKFHLLSF